MVDAPDLETQQKQAERFGHRFPPEPAPQGRDEGSIAGLPHRLRLGIEALSGLSMKDVRVHYNSSRPARVEAHAFAQGRDIHLAPGQEEHLAHEAWHVVQQKQQRVQPAFSLGGLPVNEQEGLEQEAEAMGRQALQASLPNHVSLTEGVAPGPSLPTAAAVPLQRVRWKWSQTTNTWTPLSLTTSPPPSHQGQSDGEEFDDTYSQSTDPTVKSFLRSGESFMGHLAARKQLKGIKPLPREIRVDSVKRPDSRSGSGAHEVVPTNYGSKVALSKNPVLTGLQSGFRTSTDLQLFRRTPDPEEKLPLGTIEVGAHTGFAPKPQGHGSTHTKGQGPGHDKLRETTLKLEKETDPFLAVNELGLTHIETEPTGIEILQSPYLTDLLPNDKSIGKLGPPTPSGTPQDPNRLALAQDFHKRRETVKDRLRSVKRKNNRGRSPTPPREDIDSLGGGGNYVSTPSISYPLFPVPSFEGSPSSFEFSANLSGWISAPQRRNFEFTPHLPTPFPTTTPSTSVSPTTVTPSLTTATPTLTLPTPTTVTGKRKDLGTSTPTLRRSERLKKKLKPN